MRFRKPHGISHGVCFEADTMFWYSFKILPDRLKLIRLYPCGSLGQSISFVFGARVGHFAATPQSDVVGIWSRALGVMATLSVRQKMPFFPCIYNPQITVSPTSSFSASFNGNCVKNHPLFTDSDTWDHAVSGRKSSHKLTGSSFVTQRMYKSATACHCY